MQLQDFGNHVVLQKTRSDRQWHHGVSSVRSTRQRFSCGVVQQNYAEWIRGRLVDELFTRMLSSSRSLYYIRSALRLREAPVGGLAETTKIICGAVIYANNVRFQPRADAEQTSALMNCAGKDFGRSDIADTWLVTHHFCFKCVQKCAHADSGKSLSGARREKENALPVVTLPLFRQETFLLFLWGVAASAGCRMNIVRRLRSQVSSGKHSLVFPHVLCTEGLAYLKTAAVRRNLEEPANENACVSAWWTPRWKD